MLATRTIMSSRRRILNRFVPFLRGFSGVVGMLPSLLLIGNVWTGGSGGRWALPLGGGRTRPVLFQSISMVASRAVKVISIGLTITALMLHRIGWSIVVFSSFAKRRGTRGRIRIECEGKENSIITSIIRRFGMVIRCLVGARGKCEVVC
jgi:hypothetical protein